jgi:putative flavoprotein involved in K+ transport
MWDFPVDPALPTEGAPPPEVGHARDWRGPGDAERILVVGGAHSAVEIAEEAARAGRRVWVAARRGIHVAREKLWGVDIHRWIGPLEHVPPWLAARYCDRRPTLPGTDRGFSSLRRAGKIAVVGAPARIERGRVVLVDGSAVEVDRVVLATGYRFDVPFVPPEVARATAGHLRARRGESVSWPGLFVVGAPCAARVNSEFLRGMAVDAEVVAQAIARRIG